jgi:uracil DNA glycosylase
MIKYGHLEKTPITGNLKMLAKNGILLLNSSLTVIKSKANSCSDIWRFI